jgi:hypothetical protein
VGPGSEEQRPTVAITDPNRSDDSDVPLDPGRRKTRYLRLWHLGQRLADKIQRSGPARTEDEGDVVPVDTGQLADPGRGSNRRDPRFDSWRPKIDRRDMSGHGRNIARRDGA